MKKIKIRTHRFLPREHARRRQGGLQPGAGGYARAFKGTGLLPTLSSCPTRSVRMRTAKKAVRELNAKGRGFHNGLFRKLWQRAFRRFRLRSLKAASASAWFPSPPLPALLPFNSFCGTNMFSVILANYLKYDDIPFKWFYGFRGNPLFDERFSVTLHVMEALCELAQTRIGCIGYVADGFENMNFDEVQIPENVWHLCRSPAYGRRNCRPCRKIQRPGCEKRA